ncbi:MAG: hypothetical protein ACJAVI_000329 [Candidatus Azotimanducaceae bacterium]|jgi:hypothetical protein
MPDAPPTNIALLPRISIIYLSLGFFNKTVMFASLHPTSLFFLSAGYLLVICFASGLQAIHSSFNINNK